MEFRSYRVYNFPGVGIKIKRKELIVHDSQVYTPKEVHMVLIYHRGVMSKGARLDFTLCLDECPIARLLHVFLRYFKIIHLR